MHQNQTRVWGCVCLRVSMLTKLGSVYFSFIQLLLCIFDIKTLLSLGAPIDVLFWWAVGVGADVFILKLLMTELRWRWLWLTHSLSLSLSVPLTIGGIKTKTKFISCSGSAEQSKCFSSNCALTYLILHLNKRVLLLLMSLLLLQSILSWMIFVCLFRFVCCLFCLLLLSRLCVCVCPWT